jgi:Family of unknown function (DUF5706)
MSASTGDPSPLHGTDEGNASAVIAYTERLLTETREEIGRADHKASILLSTTGVGAAILVGLLTGHWSPTHLAVAIQWLWWLGAVALVAAITFLAAAVIPRIGHGGDPSIVTYFGHVVRLTDRQRLVEHLTRSATNPLDRAVDQLVVLSRIAFRKYRCTQMAMWLIAGAATSMVASVVVSDLLH